MLRGDRRRSCRSQLPERVGLDDRLEPRVLEREQHDEERRPAGQPQKRLQPGVAELVVDARHHREDTARHVGANTRRVVDHAPREPAEARLDGGERIGRSEQLGHLLLGQVQRHRLSLGAFLTG